MKRRTLFLLLTAVFAVPLALYAAEKIQSFGGAGMYVAGNGLTGGIEQQFVQRITTGGPVALAAGDGVTLDARGMHYLTVIVADGGEATISRVDTPSTTSHSATVSLVNASGTEDFDIFLVDWPFYRVTVVDQAARVAVAH
jgi:hypothetical protein